MGSVRGNGAHVVVRTIAVTGHVIARRSIHANMRKRLDYLTRFYRGGSLPDLKDAEHYKS